MIDTKYVSGMSEIQKIEISAKWIFSQVLDAVGYLHSHNIVHRDIKLDNIILSSRSNFSPFLKYDKK